MPNKKEGITRGVIGASLQHAVLLVNNVTSSFLGIDILLADIVVGMELELNVDSVDGIVLLGDFIALAGIILGTNEAL